MSEKQDSLEKLQKEFDINKLDIFENIKNQYMSQLSEEQLKTYQEFGKKMHDGMDYTKENPYEKSKSSSNVISLEECLANIVAQVQSGLHPSFVEEQEESLLKAHYGEEWFKEFGYDSKSL